MTQVLAHETNIYMYGVGRIGEQQPDGWQYSQGDALGCVWQLSNGSCEISLVKSYQSIRLYTCDIIVLRLWFDKEL